MHSADRVGSDRLTKTAKDLGPVEPKWSQESTLTRACLPIRPRPSAGPVGYTSSILTTVEAEAQTLGLATQLRDGRRYRVQRAATPKTQKVKIEPLRKKGRV